MKYQAIARTVAGVLASALIGGAFAQVAPATRTDTSPPPPEERNSMGAVILMDEPVLAQREQMSRMLAGTPDTRAMGAGPAEVIRRTLTQEELDALQAQEAELQKNRRTVK